jgi:anti-anti-sigma factor
MNPPTARLLVWAGESLACIRIVGRANFNTAPEFKTLIAELLKQGCARFVLDLSECDLMDSTFLGVLSGFGLKQETDKSRPGDSRIELLNPNQRISELLDDLGVIHLFKICQGQLVLPDSAQAQPHEPASPSREEVTRTCLEGHKTLMAISPENAARFKEVTRFLAEDLKKLKP